MTNKSSYNEDSIQKLSPLEFTRLRPDTYLGSNQNPNQLVIELITNCVDEFLIGNCSSVYIDVFPEKITVTDDGQGILPNVKKNNGTVLQMVYGDINTSGKYDKSDDAVYKVSTGAFGIGCSLTNFLSHFLTATTWRDGEFETVYFHDGVFEKRENGKCDKSKHGVEVSFLPDEQFFISPKIDLKQLEAWLRQKAAVCSGIKFYLNGEGIYCKNGLNDLIDTDLKNAYESINHRLLFEEEDGRQKLEFGLTYTTKSSASYTGFCNYSYIEAGVPYTTIKSCITRTLNKWAKEQGLLKAKDKNLEGSNLQEGIEVVFNLVSPNIRYDSQTKVRCTSTDDNPFLNESLSKHLEVWLDTYPQEGVKIIEKAMISRKAAEAAKKAREAVKSKSEKKVEKKTKTFDLPSKLTDCYSKNRQECELFIVEGLSAAGNLKDARDNKTQAVLPVRGKILNTQKATLDKITKNAEIQDMIRAFGLEVSVDGKSLVYDKDSVRYGKIIIMSDADDDGSHIKNLFYTFIWNFAPQLIEDGFIYAGIPPLFRLKNNKEVIYLKDDEALQEFKETHNIDKYQVARLKGLGEMSPQETKDCLVNAETRNIQQLTVNDKDLADKLFSDLMGSDSIPRKKFIEENAEKAKIYV